MHRLFIIFTIASLVFTTSAMAITTNEVLQKHGKIAVREFILKKSPGTITAEVDGILLIKYGRISTDYISVASVENDFQRLGFSPGQADTALKVYTKEARDKAMQKELDAQNRNTLARSNIQKKSTNKQTYQGRYLFTINQLIKRLNISYKTISQPIRFKIQSKTENEKSYIYQASANKNLSALIGVDKRNGFVDDFGLMCGGSTVKDATNAILSLGAAIMAFEDPYMPLEKRREAIRSIGLTDLQDSKQRKFRRGKMRYSILKSKSMGTIMFTAMPPKS